MAAEDVSEGTVLSGNVIEPEDALGEKSLSSKIVVVSVNVAEAEEVSGEEIAEEPPDVGASAGGSADTSEDEMALGSLYARTTTSGIRDVLNVDVVSEVELGSVLVRYVLYVELRYVLETELLEPKLDVKVAKSVLETDMTRFVLDDRLSSDFDTRLLKSVLEVELEFTLDDRLLRPVLKVRLEFALNVRLLEPVFEVELESELDVELLATVFDVELEEGLGADVPASVFDVELKALLLEVEPRPVLNVELLVSVVEVVVPGSTLRVELIESVLAVELKAKARANPTAIAASALDVELLETVLESGLEPARSEVELDPVLVIEEDPFEERILRVDDVMGTIFVLEEVLPGSVVEEVLNPRPELEAMLPKPVLNDILPWSASEVLEELLERVPESMLEVLFFKVGPDIGIMLDAEPMLEKAVVSRAVLEEMLMGIVV